ncbi:SDR family NAD(P)-dependent oxidoreductase [Peloplasma aerotolerans]|uniref:SDR family oxidoreductase n=1 Tax=Peloplasma aerotolerans TaxID=3044389 RepID=A0AAW6U5X5_9MOLU|nr:SDR family oxidoreductase [Mariniplasma sp. M4Ah]MDI6453255.1 SDR family oxidoreductase [Mariniplasma sp. M4Ah]
MKKHNQLNILISGANDGIGYYMVESFLKQGHNVFVLDVKIDNLQHLSKIYDENKLMYVQCDVSQENQVEESIEHAISTFKKIDYMIHNACLCTFASFNDTQIETFKKVFDVNYYGAVHLIRHILPLFEKQNKGDIFVTSSGVGIMGFKNISPYSSSKGALESLVKCLNLEYKHTNISFHIIHPPLTRTASSKGLTVPNEFMAKPEVVGYGLSKRIHRRKWIITFTRRNRFTVFLMYLLPISMGKLLSSMTDKYAKRQ